MPRTKRTKATTKVYHVIIRGINKQDIFLDKQDFFKYIKEIKETKEKYKYELYAYAFMSDHVHFVFHDINNNMALAVQSLNVRYSAYYNKKYERVGHLFENRYKSRNVENEAYLKNLIRYIHKNPENAGLKPYIWTSYNEYLYKDDLVNSEEVLKIYNADRKRALEEFKEFHNNYTKNQDYNKDFELITRLSDEEAIKIVKQILNEENLLRIQAYNKKERDESIFKLKQIEGITISQLSRIIGITTKTIRKIIESTQK